MKNKPLAIILAVFVFILTLIIYAWIDIVNKMGKLLEYCGSTPNATLIIVVVLGFIFLTIIVVFLPFFLACLIYGFFTDWG